MRLSPAERDRLLLWTAAELARARRARGLRLNVPEATALIADTVCEAARDGARLAEAVEAGRSILGPSDVLPGVTDVVTDVRVEATFEDGTRLAVVADPFRRGDGATDPDAEVAAPGRVVAGGDPEPPVQPGCRSIVVVNESPVPISVTSHYHFFEANPRLRFDRAAAYGMHLRMAGGGSVRFPPGEAVTVELTPIGGARVVIGFAGLVDGPLDAPGARAEALERARQCGYLGAGAPGGTP
ncbi:MAG TPA: urease subunit gamma [Acidimicrobiales bacterium]|nr:urease subunit gamma [Acidimicrobiales bacterium]